MDWFDQLEKVVPSTPKKKELVKTIEQESAIEAAVDNMCLKLDAAAGTGKTSSLVMIAEVLRVPSLMLVFNKAAQEDSKNRFPPHVEVRTTHSVAYQDFGWEYQHKLSRPRGKYVNVAGTGSEIAKYYDLSDCEVNEDKVFPKAFIGLIIRASVDKFQSSAEEHIERKHLALKEINECEEKYNIKLGALKHTILKFAQKLWRDRTDPNSPVLCTHDTYMKLWQLSKPNLAYGIIYLDEAQDTTDCTLDVIRRQEAMGTKIIMVGDVDQSIYGFRGAVNAMERVLYPQVCLTKSFRFGPAVATLANDILDNDKGLVGFEEIDSKVGENVVDVDKPHTILYRTNIKLILEAVESIVAGDCVNIHIDTRDFCKMLVSAGALYSGNMKAVKHDKLLPYATWDDLLVETESDPDMKRVAALVKKRQATKVIRVLTGHKNRDDAHIDFLTAHKSKGLEFDQVILADDFPSHYNKEGEWVGLSDGEKKLLYVAATRAKKAVNINPTIQEIYNRDLLEELEQKEEKKQGLQIGNIRIAQFDGKTNPRVMEREFNRLIDVECLRMGATAEDLDDPLGVIGDSTLPSPPNGEMAIAAYNNSMIEHQHRLDIRDGPIEEMYEAGYCDEEGREFI